MKKSLPYVALAIAIICLIYCCTGPHEKLLHEKDEYVYGTIVTHPEITSKYGIIAVANKEDIRLAAFQKVNTDWNKVKFQLYKKGEFITAKNISPFNGASDVVLNLKKDKLPRTATNIDNIIEQMPISLHSHLDENYKPNQVHRIWHPRKKGNQNIQINNIDYIEVKLQSSVDTSKYKDVLVRADFGVQIGVGYFIESKVTQPSYFDIWTLTTDHPPHTVKIE